MDRVIVVEDCNGGPLTPWVSGAEAIRPEVPNGGVHIDWICNELLERKSTQSAKLIILCADWKPFPAACRSDQHGVTLLKHLRLGLAPDRETEGIKRTHVVVCSCEPAEELIRRKPGNTILLSDGVTFLRLPEGLDRLADAAFLEARGKVRATISKKYLYPYVASDYEPPDMHQVSNWWGVYQIWDVRNQARIDNAPLKLPERVLREVRKLEGKKALCLYGEDNPSQLSEADGDALYKLETEVYNAGPRLALIDDEADMGWSDVLRSTLSSKATKPEQLAKYVKAFKSGENLRQVLDFDPDVVLLDLRLRGNDEIGTPVGDTSGASVLRAIRKLDCGLPVILMTASNKYWTYREMLKLGADGYWMKEGLGEHRPLVSAAEHYSELLRLMLLCIGKPTQQTNTASLPLADADSGYKDLRFLSRAFNKLKLMPSPWWINATWPQPRSGKGQAPGARQIAVFQATKAPREKVEAQYENSLSLLRSYLQGHVAGLTFVAHRDMTSAASEELRAIGMAAGKAIEIVHCFDKLQAAGIDGKAQHIGGHGGDTFRKDYLGQALYRFRNDCAHAGNAPPTFAQVRDYIALVLAYLQCKPDLGSIHQGTLISYVSKNGPVKNAYYALRGTDKIESYLANLRP